MLHQQIGVRAVARSHRDADARADEHMMAVELERRGYDFPNSLCQGNGLGGGIADALDDGKFVATQACNGIRLPDAAPQALSDDPEQGIADRVTERVVDL